MQDTPQEAAIGDKAARELLVREKLKAVNAELLEALQVARKELHACQAVIHLRGGFDPAYVNDAQKALKIIDAAIAKALGETK